jgi:uncharacterized OsmC-like protein
MIRYMNGYKRQLPLLARRRFHHGGILRSKQSLNEFLTLKGIAMTDFFQQALGISPEHEKTAIAKPMATTTVEGRSGVRRISIRNHQILADSPPHWVGYNLGATAPEIALGSLGACLAHMYVATAGMKGITMDEMVIETSAELDLRKGQSGFENHAPGLDSIECTVRIKSSESIDTLKQLHEDVEKTCPVYVGSTIEKNKGTRRHITRICSNGQMI